MASARVASRYIKSLMVLAEEKKVLDDVHSDMQLFDKICQDNRDFVMMLRSPMVRHEIKRSILHKLFSGKVNKITLAMIEIITHKNREALLPQIAGDFHEAYNTYKGVGRASVITTIPMDKAMRETIEAMARKLSGKQKVEVDESVDKELIGGFVLHVGDQQIDASVRGKLRALRTKFKEDYYVKQA